MKKINITILHCILSISLYSQTIYEEKYVPDLFSVLSFETDTLEYVRPTIVLIQYDNNEKYTKINQGSNYSEKFNMIIIPFKHFQFKPKTNQYEIKPNTNQYQRQKEQDEFFKNIANTIKDTLQKNNAINQIYEAWFNRKKDSTMNFKNIKLSTQYNASADDHQLAERAKRGEAIIEDNYIKSIEKTYIGVYEHITKQPYGCLIYYFRLDSVKQCIQEIFEEFWIDSTLTAQEKKIKYEKFQKRKFPIKFIGVGKHDYEIYKDYNTNEITQNENLDNLYIVLERIINHNIESKIISTKPISARIGTKEGDVHMHYYQVQEYKINRNGDTIIRNVGIIKPKKISNNKQTQTTIKTTPTTFIQIQGKKIEEGMTIKQIDYMNVKISTGYTKGTKNNLQEAQIFIKGTWDDVIEHFAFDFEMLFKGINIIIGFGPYCQLTKNTRLYLIGGAGYITNDKNNNNKADKDETEPTIYFNSYIQQNLSKKIQIIIGGYYKDWTKSIEPQIGLQYTIGN